jgi:hypothetical protein
MKRFTFTWVFMNHDLDTDTEQSLANGFHSSL